MASAVTSIYEYPISAASAAYAPTNTAEVTAMIDSAVSGKLDASASSEFQPSGNYQTAGDYVSSSELANYQTTAGMSAYATTAAMADKLDSSASSSFMPASASGDYMPASSSADFQTTAGMSAYQTVDGMSAYQSAGDYATTADLSAKLDASASSAFITSTSGLVSTGDLENYQTTAGMSGYATTGDLSTKLDASASSAFLTSQVQASWSETSSSSPAYIVDRPTEGTLSAGDYMDISVSGNVVTLGVTGVATTADLSAKLDASASSAFITSTAGLVATGDLSSYLATSSIGVDTASAITSIAGSSIAGGGGGASYTAGQYIQISGDEISVTGINPGDYAQSSSLADYQTTAGMSGYATTADLSAKLDASASSAFLTAQEQASWSETASSSPSYIVDKPDLVDIVAGPGIVVDNPDGNTLRVSTEADAETVLYDAGDSPSQSGPWQISEARTNFEWIDVVFGNDSAGSMKQVTRFAADSSYMKLHLPRYDEEPSYKWSTMTLSWNNTTASIKSNSVGRFTIASNGSVSVSTAAAQAPYLFQIIGVHRISGGN